MKRPGIGRLNNALDHSSISDLRYKIEYMDITGDGDLDTDYEHIQHRNMSMRTIFSLINKYEIQLNKEDINVYGYWNVK